MYISAVSPEVSVIEVGAGNSYGHPHSEILKRLQEASTVYRTDLDGTIIVTTDGSIYTVMTEKTGTISSGNGIYSPTSSVTEEAEPNESMISSSTVSTVYISDLNLQDEWVKISNTGSSPVSLDDWKIEDDSKHAYTFSSYTLDSQSTVIVYTGEGTNTATELYWGSKSTIWNNDGDTAYLYDDSGKLVSKLEK